MKLFECITGTENEYSQLVSVALPYYTSFHRRYHNANHILEGAELALQLSTVSPEFNLSLSQQLAWLFHDIVYIPFRETGDNENDSVHLMRHLLEGYDIDVPGLTDDDMDEASRIIIDTIDHRPRYAISRPIIDIDLFGFAEPELFYRNNRLIQEEFGIKDDQYFLDGQREFLTSLIENRETLYTTNHAHIEWEDAAQRVIRSFIR